MNRIIVIVCGVMYDLLRKAPLLSVTRRGISLFAKRGATILEGVLYGVAVIIISNRFMALLSLENPPKEDKKVSKEPDVVTGTYTEFTEVKDEKPEKEEIPPVEKIPEPEPIMEHIPKPKEFHYDKTSHPAIKEDLRSLGLPSIPKK